MEAAFCSIPLCSGYMFTQWNQGIDVVISNKKFSTHVSDVCTIVLYKVDFNFTTKHIACKCMKATESIPGGITAEQYGSRKGHKAIDHVLNKILTLDILQQSKQAGVLIPNNLKSCYDRISHTIASLALQKYGIQPSGCVCMLSMISNLEHRICTAFGDSD